MREYQIERASYNGSIEASQASDVGSIPIARSITHDVPIGLTRLTYPNSHEKCTVLDPKWTPVSPIGPPISVAFNATCTNSRRFVHVNVSFRIANHSPRTHCFFGSIRRVWIAGPSHFTIFKSRTKMAYRTGTNNKVIKVATLRPPICE